MKKKIIFLDRDGVINKNRDDYVKSPTEFEFVREIEKWLKILKNHDFKLIVITNQSMIGRGLASKTDLKKIHIKMQNHFLKQGFKIDRIYYCPHTPNDNCNCRKPKTKLLKKAINDFNVDLKNSWASIPDRLPGIGNTLSISMSSSSPLMCTLPPAGSWLHSFGLSWPVYSECLIDSRMTYIILARVR